MAKIIGTLRDRQGPIIINTLVVAREANNPTGDRAEATSNAQGQFELTVALAGTLYDLWVEEETTTGASNYLGRAVSSGDVVASFNLCTDISWKSEHYGSGEAQACGEHKLTQHDGVILRTAGYHKSIDSFMEFRLGSDTDKFRVLDSGDTFFFSPRPIAGVTNSHMGLAEGYDGVSRFYFGTAKTFYINSSGAFNLASGQFNGDVAFAEAGTFSKNAIFTGDSSYFPQLVSYAAGVNDPTISKHLTPKGYVDSAITAALTALNQIYQENTSVAISDPGGDVGQIITTIDGSIVGRAVDDKFGFGEDFTPSEVLHVRHTTQSRVRVEKTGVGFSILDHESIGTLGASPFGIRTNGVDAISIASDQKVGIGVAAGSVTEKLDVNGQVALDNYLNFKSRNVPADPSTDEARVYLKQRDANNNELAAKIKKSGAIQEVLLTSPRGLCRICGKEHDARDPYFDTNTGKMILEFYCGHKYEMDLCFRAMR